MKEYNTAEIRSAARRLNTIADRLQTLKSYDLSRISSEAATLKGDTADALQDELEKHGAELLALKKNVDQCSSTLFEFARMLDLADEKAKSMMTSQ